MIAELSCPEEDPVSPTKFIELSPSSSSSSATVSVPKELADDFQAVGTILWKQPELIKEVLVLLQKSQ